MAEPYVEGKMIELIRYAAMMNKETGAGPREVALTGTEYDHLVKDLGQIPFPATPILKSREMTVNGIKITTTGE